MNNIGIICPSDAELKPFLQRLSNPKITEKAMLRFYEGCLDSASVVILYSGVCKVNAAIAAHYSIFFKGTTIKEGGGGEELKTHRCVTFSKKRFFYNRGDIKELRKIQEKFGCHPKFLSFLHLIRAILAQNARYFPGLPPLFPKKGRLSPISDSGKFSSGHCERI